MFFRSSVKSRDEIVKVIFGCCVCFFQGRFSVSEPNVVLEHELSLAKVASPIVVPLGHMHPKSDISKSRIVSARKTYQQKGFCLEIPSSKK